MEILIENGRVKFTQGVQTFNLDYEGDEEELKWIASQLDVAFKRFKDEVLKDFVNKQIESITIARLELIAPLVECRENLLRYIPNCAGDGSHNGNVLKRVEQAILKQRCKDCDTLPMRLTENGIRFFKCSCGNIKILNGIDHV